MGLWNSFYHIFGFCILTYQWIVNYLLNQKSCSPQIETSTKIKQSTNSLQTTDNSQIECNPLKESSTEENLWGILVLLPEEVRTLVFSFLDLPSLASAARVNHQWRDFTKRETLWQQRCHFDFANVTLPSNKTWQELYRELSVPLEEDYQFHRCNYGYLGEHSAVQKLHGQPVGTFLFRSSSIDASAITISFVVPGGTVQHRRMYRDASRGGSYTFQLPSYNQANPQMNIFYKNYHSLLRDNSHWLKTPLVAIHDTSANLWNDKRKIEVTCRDHEGPPSSAELHSLAESLRHNFTTAKDLSIRGNVYFGFRIGNADLAKLVSSLEENKSVVNLQISHMHLNDTVCEALARLIRVTQTLSKLSLYHCSCATETVSVVVAALREETNLKALHLHKKVWRVDVRNDLTESDFTQ